MISYANHFWGAIGSAFRLGVQANDRWLVCLPLFHVGGIAILFRSCLYGTTVVLQNGFDSQAILQSLRADEITLISLVPTMLARLMAHGLTHSGAPALRLILLGGAAAEQELLAATDIAGLPVAVTYGLTEAASQVATKTPPGVAKKPGSAGRPLLFSELKVIDENGSSPGLNNPGEVVVRGPTVMAGYYGDSEATDAALKDGWLHTGDIGYLDQDGDLWIMDRRSDLIVSGGENVYPAEIERVLAAHPSVASACVVGLPHPGWGQQVAAFIVPNEGAAVSADELLAFGRAHLAGYKQPRLIVFGAEMPLTSSGKIHRREVSKRLASLAETG
jgi:O-succinylbenzoic acid--CoA ligase